MCKCTPAIRTPFCGKPDCQWPKQSQAEHPTFDLEQVYDDKIKPLMSQIIAICQQHQMPMIASFTPPPEVLRGELRGELRILQARHAIAIELLTMAYGVVSLRFPGSVLATTLRDHLDGELSNG